MTYDSKLFGICRAFLVICLLPAVSGGCSNADLGGSTSSRSAQDSRKSDSRPDGTFPKSDRGSPDDSNRGDGDDDNGPNGPLSEDRNVPNSVSNQNLNEITECLKTKNFNYNVVIVLDNSISQKENDPNKVRLAVSLDFANKFNGLVARKPDTNVQISVVSFARTARESSWIRLDGKDDPAVPSDPIDDLRKSIITATTDEGRGTQFKPAFEAAARLLQKLGPTRLDANRKNYVLFMTDGEPTGSYSIKAISAQLVDENKAAVLAIASGSKISKTGEKKVEALAVPKGGDHTGRYYRAVTANDMKIVWSKLFEDVVGCK